MIEKNTYKTAKEPEKAVLVAITPQGQSNEKTNEYLDELAFLAETSNVITLKRFMQKMERPDNGTFVGKGKLDEILAYVRQYSVDMVIFDDDLSASQVRNLETILECKILDRSLLILNTFSMRAQTAQSKTQVELAQYKYLLPRLTRMWTHLTKQKGGVGMRGPGEKELETDKRIVKDRIVFLSEKLKEIEKQSETRRKTRYGTVRVALVGYTNVGKSTLMNVLSKGDVFAENKLFATVDSTVRKCVINRIPFLLTDTVGFIRKLPTMLIESFKSTLNEIVEADILLHIIDISHTLYEEQIKVVQQILTDIKANDKVNILVFNKIDLYKKLYEDKQQPDNPSFESPLLSLEQIKESYLGTQADKVVFVSATNKQNIDELKKVIFETVRDKYYQIYPNFLSREEDWLYDNSYADAVVTEE